MSNLQELVRQLDQLSNDIVYVKGDEETKKAFLIKNLIALSGKGSLFEVILKEGRDINRYEGLIYHKEIETFALHKDKNTFMVNGRRLPIIDFTLENLVSLRLIVPFFEKKKWENR